MSELVVEGIWLGGYAPTSTLRINARGTVRAVPTDEALPTVPMTVLPGIVDCHVHLGLVDYPALAEGPVVEVHDLGWDPAAIRGIQADPPDGVEVKLAGPFHTAPGGYPSGRPWAPSAAVSTISTADEARQAAEDARVAGYDFFKIALNADMVLLDDVVLHALVGAAHEAGLPVAVHAEGPGQAVRAIDAGADILVHAPWTERLSDDEIARATRMTWLSTLAIHGDAERSVASDNLRRFRAAGGEVRYGTDLGNGPAPVGLNPVEVLALGAVGLEGDDLLVALTGVEADGVHLSRLFVSPLPLPTTAADAVEWYANSRRLTTYLEEHNVTG